MECGICKRSQKDGFYNLKCKGLEYVEKCPRPHDPIPILSEENEKFWKLFDRIRSGLMGDGGFFNYGAIETVFRAWGVKDGQRPILLDRCLVVIEVIKRLRKAKQ